jgi:hypothetical protein
MVWTGLVAAMGAAVGRPPGAVLLTTIATVIAGFIAAVLRLFFARLAYDSGLNTPTSHCP